MIEIREMKPEERGQVLELLQECRTKDYANEKGFFSFPPDRGEVVLEKAERTFVALDESRVVGTVSITGASCGSLVVTRRMRRRGIARQLLEAATKYAHERLLAVAVPLTHVNAMLAFSRAGFRTVGVIMERHVGIITGRA